MRARCLTTLTLALVTLVPAVSGERGPSYSLEQLRALARSVHPTLEAAEAAVKASSGILKQARAYPNPELALGYGRGRPRDGGESRSENEIQLAQRIELFGIRKWRTRLAEMRLQGVEMDRLLAETVINNTVDRLVYTVLLEERRSEIARESAEVAGHLHELLARRAEIGESSPLEVTKARTEWFARRWDLLGGESAMQAARSALRLFCGDKLPNGYQVAETLQDSKALDLPVDLGARLQNRNPLLLRARVAEEEAQVKTEVAKKETFPAIDLFAGHVTELDRESTNIGLGLTIPLWNRHQGSILAATAQQSVASADYRALTLDLETSLAQASADYRQALGAIRLHQEGWTSSAKESLEIVTFSFENGEASLLAVLDAQRSYLSVALAEVESWAKLALARADIERLTAGPLAGEHENENE